MCVGLAGEQWRFSQSLEGDQDPVRTGANVRRAALASPYCRGRAGHLAKALMRNLIRDDRDFERHVDYAHCSPVKYNHSRGVGGVGLIQALTAMSDCRYLCRQENGTRLNLEKISRGTTDRAIISEVAGHLSRGAVRKLLNCPESRASGPSSRAEIFLGIHDRRADILEVAGVACREDGVAGFADSGNLSIAHIDGASFSTPYAG